MGSVAMIEPGGETTAANGLPEMDRVAPTVKPVPVIVIIVPPLPPTIAGETEVITGRPLRGLFTVKLTLFDVPPPGALLITATGWSPVEFKSTPAVRVVLFTYAVCTALPRKLICESLTKPVPVTVIVMLEPEKPEAGETDAIAGTGFTTFNVAGAEVPPPGGGLMTVTLTEPA